jgi:putative thioredoxin
MAMIDLQLGLKPQPAASFVKDTDEAHFERDVMHASMSVPVIVQFRAAGSALCLQISPILEKLVAAAGGAVQLVRVDVGRSPGLAQALRIQAVPTVYVFFQGRPVDGFTGSKSEAELKTLIEGLQKLSGAPQGAPAIDMEQVKKLIAEADGFFREGKLEAAMERYGAALDLAPEEAEPLAGIGWCLLSQGDAESVREMFSQVPAAQLETPRFKGLKYILSLGDEANNIEALIDRLVAAVKKNREGAERAKLLEVFEALGPAHPLTAPGRRKLSTVLFS